MGTTWQKQTEIPKYEKLYGDISTETVIIGGGATGITLAYLLAKEGRSVVVIDKNSLEKSATARTTAFLCENVDTTLPSLVRLFGKDRARGIWLSGEDAINTIEEIIKEEKIDCEFKKVSEYVYALKDAHMKRLDKEYKTARELGFAVEKFKSDELPFRNSGGYEIKNQAKFHPIKYFAALRERAEKYGAKFYDETEAIEIAEKIPAVTTERGRIIPKYIVVATHLSIKNPPTIFLRKGTYISYIMELAVEPGKIPEGIYEDTHDPYHYFRIDRGETEDRMILGGADHRKELPIDPEKNYNALMEYFKERFPDLKYEVRERWQGPIIETLDGIPYIGIPDRSKPSLFVATGYSGNGMTYSTTAAQIITDTIIGRENSFAHLYDPYRPLNPLCIPIKARDYAGALIGGYLKNIWK